MKKSFKAVLENSGAGLGWTVVRVPFDATKVWKGKKVRMRVCGTVNGAGFRTSLFPHAQGGQMLLVNKALQKAAKVALGMTVSVEMEPDVEERPAAQQNPLLEKILKSDPALRAFYDEMSESAKREIERHIAEPKSEAARQKRVEQMAERMMFALEGERDLPPLLVQVFRRYPKALAGWKAMTPNQRRRHLMGVAAYKSPESREKRAVKAAEDATAHSLRA